MTDRTPPPPHLGRYQPGKERRDTHAAHVRDPGRAPAPQRSGRPPSRAGSRLVAGLVYAVLGLIALAGGAALFLMLALRPDAIQARIAAEVKERTGRDLVVAGPASFTVYPALGVALGGVSLSGPPGTDTRPLVEMAALDVSVHLLPLLAREVKVKRLVLHEPRFNLEVDSQGRKSWDFASMRPQERLHRVRVAEARTAQLSDAPAPRETHPVQEARRPFADLALADVRIVGGTVHYADARTGAAHTVEEIDAALALASITSPLETNGRLVWRGKPVSFGATLTSLDAVLDDRPAKLALALKCDTLEADFDGTASFAPALDAAGMLRARAASARALTSWLGTELAPSNGFGPLSISGLASLGTNGAALSNAEIALDGVKAEGEITLKTGGARPVVKASLALSEVDLDLYKRTGPAPAAASPPPGTPAAPKAIETIDDLLSREAPPGPRVKGFSARDGWSEEPIDAAPLGLLDADAKLTLAGLRVGDVRVGASAATVVIEDRVLKATFREAALYEGQGKGFVVVDAGTPGTVAVGASMTLEGISALPFLEDAAALDWLSGKGNVTLNLESRGTSERALVEALDGTADVKFTDGAIVGVNIPAMLRGAGEGNLGALKTAPTEKTDFSELSATWTVTKGVAENKDLRLVSPLLRVTGEGRVMLPAREIDYLLKPRLVADLTGQGGAEDVKGIEVPVRVEGSWEKPKFKPDLETVLEDPSKAVETIKEIGKKFKGKSTDEILKGLFGGKSKDEGASKN